MALFLLVPSQIYSPDHSSNNFSSSPSTPVGSPQGLAGLCWVLGEGAGAGDCSPCWVGAGPTTCLSSCSHGCLPGCRGGQPGGGGSQVTKQAKAGRECSMHCKSCRGRGIQQRPGVPKSQSRHGPVGVYSPPRLLVRHPLYASCCALEWGSGLRTADQGLWSVWAVLTVPIGLYGVLGA